MVDDITRKLEVSLKNLQRIVARLLSGRFLENSAIRSGRMRFIGGVLRLDSGALLELIGQWRFFGNGAITGDVVAEGKWTQNGPWEFNGPGDIAGDVDLAGDMSVTGNVIILPGGKIQVGNIVIDPTISGGAVAFQNGAQVFTDASTIQVYLGNGVLQVSNSEVKLQLGGTSLRLTSGHILAAGMATKAVGTVPGGFVGAIVYDAGEWKRLI